MRDVVARQVELGLSVVNDGEQGRADYTVYVKDRLIGFSGESAPWPNPDVEEFPEWTEMARQFAPPFQKRPACTGPVTWKDWPAVERDIRNLADAAGAARADDVFMTSPSPGQIGRFLQNRYYRTDEEYLYTLAGLSGPRPRPAHAVRPPDALEEFRRVAAMHVEVLDHAVADIPTDRMRMSRARAWRRRSCGDAQFVADTGAPRQTRRAPVSILSATIAAPIRNRQASANAAP